MLMMKLKIKNKIAARNTIPRNKNKVVGFVWMKMGGFNKIKRTVISPIENKMFKSLSDASLAPQ